jgi:hypothetical protein
VPWRITLGIREQSSTTDAKVAAVASRQHGIVTREYHRGSVAMEDDHARDLALRAHGIETRRYTGAQLETEPGTVAADLRDQRTPAGLTISRR